MCIRDSNDPLLRRPFSITKINNEQQELTVIYRVEGKGTKQLALKDETEYLSVLGPLGNGFPIAEAKAGSTALLIGGGIGVPPLYELSLRLKENGVNVIHVLGFNSKADIFYKEQFEELGDTFIATIDGTYGIKGTAVSYTHLPPLAAASVPVAIVSLCSAPGSRKWTCKSTKPGKTTLSETSIISWLSGAILDSIFTTFSAFIKISALSNIPAAFKI